MHRVKPNSALPAGLPLENKLPIRLQGLIATVSAVATAALSFWVAGMAGLAIGALAGFEIAFALLKHLEIGNPQPLNVDPSDLTENRIEAKPPEIDDPRLDTHGVISPPLNELESNREIAIVQPLTDIDRASEEELEGLIDFFNKLEFPDKPEVQGSIEEQARKIQTWMKQSEEIQNCETLELNSSTLNTIPKEIGLFTHLTCLDLEYNEIQFIPAEIGNLQALKSLHLSQNKLKALPPEIGNLQALVSLYLSENELQALPPEVGNLQALELLDLSHNQLQDLPFEIGNLEAFQCLYLTDNEFQAIPPVIGNLRALEYIDLSGNRLQEFLPQIGNLQNIEDGIYQI